jgi:hypothetical protein
VLRKEKNQTWLNARILSRAGDFPGRGNRQRCEEADEPALILRTHCPRTHEESSVKRRVSFRLRGLQKGLQEAFHTRL